MGRVSLVAAFLWLSTASDALAQSTYYLWTGQSGAQTQVDVKHKSSWYIIVSSGSSFTFGGGKFAIKKGSRTSDTISLKLYQNNSAGTLLATQTVSADSVTQSFTTIDFSLASPVTLTAGTYYATVTSAAPDTASEQYFIKGQTDAIIALSDGTTVLSSAIASASATPAASNLTLSKSATGTVNIGGTITYTINLGNDGGSPSSTSATVADKLPTGETATATSAGTGVSSVSCTNLNVASATLTCTVTLSAALDAGAAPGAAAFTITATAPSTGGSITNYASVDASGGSSPATPGASCTTKSCGSASTTVTAPNLTITKTASAGTLTRGGTGTFTLTVTNSGDGATDGTTVTVTDTLPTGLTPTAASGTGWTCSVSSPTVTCTRTDTLNASASYAAISVTASVASDANASLTNTASVVGGGDSSSASGAVTVNTAAPTVTIMKVHYGDFVRGALDAQFFLIVSNSGTASATGSSRITDNIPQPLVPLRAQGDGWACGIQGQLVTCTRNDALAGGSSFPPVVISVSVPTSSPDSIVNSAGFNGTIAAQDIVTVSDVVKVVDPMPVDLTVTKTVERSPLRIGDRVTFMVGAGNPSRFVLEQVELRDTLPQGFMYLPGTAVLSVIGPRLEDLAPGRVTTAPAPENARHGVNASSAAASPAFVTVTRPITGTMVNGELVFDVGSLVPGAKAEVHYGTVVAPTARTGRFVPQVYARAISPLGEQLVTIPVGVDVVLIDDSFLVTQLLIGRVFEDANGNGTFDTDEKGVPNVRIVTASGLSATTDMMGQFNLPALAAGATMVAIDPSTIPETLALPAEQHQLGGAARLMRTPLEGGTILRENFPLVPATAPRSRARSARLATGSGGEAPRGPAARIEFVSSNTSMTAGGSDRRVFLMRLTDPAGGGLEHRVRVRTSLGTLAPVSATDASQCDLRGRAEERQELFRELEVTARGGFAAICLISSVQPGEAFLQAAVADDAEHLASAAVRFDVAGRSPLLVAFGEVGLGLSASAKPGADLDARRVDGQLNLFFQGSASEGDLLTVAVRTKESINRATGATGLFERDPTTVTYPVRGDASTTLALAQSSSHVYARYDVGRSYLFFGDLKAEQSQQRSGLMEFGRNVTGLRGRLQNDRGSRWLEAQVSRPRTAYARQIVDALTGSLVSLSHSSVVPGTEVVTLEVRDRRNPELIASRDVLLRNVDYVIDPSVGLLQVLRRLPLFDQSLNLLQLVIGYEYETTGLDSMAYFGRGSATVNGIGLRLGGAAFLQNASDARFSVGGIELEQSLGARGRLTIELPMSHGQLPLDVRGSTGPGVEHNGSALRVSLERAFGQAVTVRAKHDHTDRGFANPYGAITVPGQAFSSGSVDVRLPHGSSAVVTAQLEKNRNALVDNTRQTVGARITQSLGGGLTATGGFDERRLKDALRQTEIQSQLLSGSLRWSPARRFSASITREHNLQEFDPTYPNQTVAGAQLDITPSARLFATQRWSAAPIIPISGVEAGGLLASPLSTRETAVGVMSNLGPYTGLTSRYQVDSTINGTDSFAVIGATARAPLHRTLSLDFSIDSGTPLAGTKTGYLGGGVALAYLKGDDLRMTARYETRRGNDTQHIAVIGGVGRLTSNISMLANYRVADTSSRETSPSAEARVALAVRPRHTDRAAVLLSAERTHLGSLELQAPASVITDTLSTDGYLRLAPGLESYSRIALFRTSSPAKMSELNRLVQVRLQRALTLGFDIAAEVRRVESSSAVTNIGAIELGAWIGRPLRVGFGYSTDGFHNPGSLLRATASRGGPYLVFSSTLSSLFDLMRTEQ